MDWLINLLGQLVLAYFLGALILAGWQTLKEAAEEENVKPAAFVLAALREVLDRRKERPAD